MGRPKAYNKPFDKKRKRSKKKQQRHPLETEIMESIESGYLKAPKKDYEADSAKKIKVDIISDKMSAKILEHAQLQRVDMEENKLSNLSSHDTKSKNLLNCIGDNFNDEQEEIIDVEWDGVGISQEISIEDERALEMFMPDRVAPRQTLADLIMQKLAEQGQNNTEDVTETVAKILDPRIVKVYTEVGSYMRGFKSGAAPKPFKIIPSLKNWEEILLLTKPEKWSANAMFVATRIFTTNMNPRMAQRFFNLVLLPRVRRDIEKNKRLNFHLYNAVKKSIFKPQAFFKGILLPLAREGCSPREAIILSSILKKFSIPAIHSAVALLKLSQLPYSGCTTLFMRTLVDKKYSLPSRVVNTLVEYFFSFKSDPRVMPVIWHQNLLCFVQRYKFAMTSKQRGQLKKLLRHQKHPQMTPEVHREMQVAMVTMTPTSQTTNMQM